MQYIVHSKLNFYLHTECPVGSTQVGSLRADISGCGMEGCNARYQDKYPDIDSCNKGCQAKSNCKAFTWAPMNDDPNHPGKSACSLYDIDAPTSRYYMLISII